MIILTKLIVLTVILVMGLKISTSNGMIFQKIGKWAKDKVDKGYMTFDLIACEWCAGTWLSIIAHLVAVRLGIVKIEFDLETAIRWPIVVMGASAVSGLIWTIYLMINDIKDNNEEQAKYFKNLNNGEQKSE